jgi:hypothetical protein
LKIKKYVPLLWSILVSSSLSFGADQDSTESSQQSDGTASPDSNMESTVPTDDLPMDQVDMQESRKSRISKNYKLGVRTGFIVGSISGSGLDTSYLLDSQSQIELSYNQGSADYTDEFTSAGSEAAGISIDLLAIETQVMHASYRKFFGNSFNMSLGLGYRVVKTFMELSEETTGSRIEMKTESSSVVAQAAIGNQWYWFDGFYLGIDWIGLLAPLTSGYKAEVSTEGTVSTIFDELKADSVDLAKDLGGTTSYSLLVLSLGWAF